MAFQLPKLSYSYDALEPYLDAKTMEIHHLKHHATYTSNLNSAILGKEFENESIENILIKGFDIPKIRNNAGGFYNHNLFWEIISPYGGREPQDKLMDLINFSFGSFQNFKQEFIEAAVSRFGSGWAWLCQKVSNQKLLICSTANQDNPLMPDLDCSGKPILGLDVWEHAYYLKYQNKRLDYIHEFFHLINWNSVSSKLV